MEIWPKKKEKQKFDEIFHQDNINSLTAGAHAQINGRLYPAAG